MLRYFIDKMQYVFSKLGVLLGLIVLMGVLTIATPNFLTASNLLTVTLQISVYALLTMGMAYVLIVCCIDLSAGSIIGLTGMSFVVGLQLGLPLIPSLILGLIVGLLCGFVNGLLITKMHLIPFIATLGTMYMYRGFTQLLTTGTSVSIRNLVSADVADKVLFLGGGKLFGILAIPTIVVIIFMFIHTFILKRTTLGRRLFAVGSNAEAARLSGINKDKIIIVAYCMSGFMAGIAGILLACRLMSAQPQAGTMYELEAIAAGVIGGISLMGGQGTIFGAVLGSFILGIMRNGLNLVGVNTFWQTVFTGAIIILAVYIDTMSRYKKD